MKNDISFGVSGIPKSTVSPSYINGLKRIAELDLDAFELAFVQFVSMSEDTAAKFKEELENIQNEKGKEINISVHAPYFINLNAADDIKIEESIKRIIKAADRGMLAGAKNIVFHPGFYLKSTPEEAYKKVSESIKKMLKIYYENITDHNIKPMLRPETTGKPMQFGSLDELIALSNDFEEILPCVDFAHLHARTNGEMNSRMEFEDILEKLKYGLGEERGIRNMHIHYSGIEYSEKGERRHLPLKSSDAKYEELVKTLKKFNVKGNVICESPDMEDDALLLKQAYLK